MRVIEQTGMWTFLFEFGISNFVTAALFSYYYGIKEEIATSLGFHFSASINILLYVSLTSVYITCPFKIISLSIEELKYLKVPPLENFKITFMRNLFWSPMLLALHIVHKNFTSLFKWYDHVLPPNVVRHVILSKRDAFW